MSSASQSHLINPTRAKYATYVERFCETPALSDINFNSELQENAAMSQLIDCLHATGGVPVTHGYNDGSMEIMWRLIKWLDRQQKVHLQIKSFFSPSISSF